MYRGPADVDELLKELHASEQPPQDAFLGQGRRLQAAAAAPSSSDDVSEAMVRMEERLARLNVEQAAAPRPGGLPRHGRRAPGVAAPAAADGPPVRRRSGGSGSEASDLTELAALEQAARQDARRESALRQRIATLRQQLDEAAGAEGAVGPSSTVAAGDAAAAVPTTAAVAVKRPSQHASASEAQGRELGAAVGRRLAQLRRQAGARAAALDALETEANAAGGRAALNRRCSGLL